MNADAGESDEDKEQPVFDVEVLISYLFKTKQLSTVIDAMLYFVIILNRSKWDNDS